MDRLIKGEFNIEVTCAGYDENMFVFITNSTVESEVVKYAALKTGLNHKTFRTVVVDEIPRNDSGKIKYKELEKYYD